MYPNGSTITWRHTVSKADEFKQNLNPTRRLNWRMTMQQLEESDPDLLAAIHEVFRDNTASTAMIVRSLEAVGIDMGYSSVVRWRDHVRR